MSMDSREVESKLQSKFGFVPAVSKSSDHRWYKLELEGLPIIMTKFSHSGKNLSSTIEGYIPKQLKVRKPFFEGMIRCKNSQQDYYHQVRQDPFPPW